MSRVLIASERDLTPELGRTVLWRADIERLFAPSLDAALELTRSRTPRLLVIDGSDAGAAMELLRQVRSDPRTRRVSAAVISRSNSLSDEEGLRRAGANLVLPGQADPFIWDDRLEELMEVPPRREVRIGVRFAVWSRFAPEEKPTEALALNISLHGMLLETGEAVDLGSKLDLAFTLPGRTDETRAVAQVVREGEIVEERTRYGLEFLILLGDARSQIRGFIEAEAGR